MDGSPPRRGGLNRGISRRVSRRLITHQPYHNEESLYLMGFKDDDLDPTRASKTFRNFCLMSIFFSAIAGSGIACLSLATARFGSIGAEQSVVLYLTYTACAVSGATFVVKRYGSRDSILLGMALYFAYIACFLLADLFAPFARIIALCGAAVGGIGAGIIWTSQGVYFSQAAEDYSLQSGVDWEESNALLAGVFAFALLAEETSLDLLSTVLIRYFHMPWTVVFAVYTGIAFCATIGMTFVRSYHTPDMEQFTFDTALRETMSTFRLLRRDAKMKYMFGINAAFGLAAGFLGGFVAGEVVPVALHDEESSYIGLLIAIHGIVAAIFSLIFGNLSQEYGKEPVLVIGALAFASVALPFLFIPDATRWNWPLLILVFALQGVGRATFEGTLRGLFADYFAYMKEAAFANIILQNGLSSALAYVLSYRLTCSEASTYCIRYRDGTLHNMLFFAALVVGTSLLAIAGFWRANVLYESGQGNDRLYAHRRQSLAVYRSSKGFKRGDKLDRTTYAALEAILSEEFEDIENDYD